MKQSGKAGVFLVLLLILVFIVGSLLTIFYFIGRNVKLEYDYKEGDVLSYKINIAYFGQIAMRGKNELIDTRIDAIVNEKIINRSPDDIYDIEIQTKSMTMNMNGKIYTMVQTPTPAWIKMTKNGTVLEAKTGPAAVDNPSGQNAQYEMILPNDSVTVGQKWQNDKKIMLPGQTEPLPLTVEYSLQDIRKYRDINCAIIKSEIKEIEVPTPTGEKVRARGSGTTFFDYADGKVVKNDFDLYLFLNKPGTNAIFNLKMRISAELQ